jgi:DNA-binding CsgD family transcriptional regulator
LYQTSQSPQWRQYFKGFAPTYTEVTVGEFSALLHRMGFIIHRLEFDNYETTFDHPDSLHQWLGTWASHKNRIPQKKRDHFLDETVSGYLTAHHHSHQDAFPYYEYLLEVICEKPIIPIESSRYSSCQYSHLHFTPQEAKVLQQFLKGKTAKEIGLMMSISAKTAEFHLGKIKEKLGCHYRSEIYQAAFSYGFIDLIFSDAL